MPVYTFYPCRADGSSLTFQSLELSDDCEARSCALAVLQEHRTSDYVVAWSGERKVFTRHRAEGTPAGSPHRP